MSRTKIELNSAGIRAFLRGGDVADYLGTVAGNVAAKCGDGYGTDTYTTPGRVVSSVYTDGADAARDNIENNTLLKAVSG